MRQVAVIAFSTASDFFHREKIARVIEKDCNALPGFPSHNDPDGQFPTPDSPPPALHQWLFEDRIRSFNGGITIATGAQVKRQEGHLLNVG